MKIYDRLCEAEVTARERYRQDKTEAFALARELTKRLATYLEAPSGTVICPKHAELQSDGWHVQVYVQVGLSVFVIEFNFRRSGTDFLTKLCGHEFKLKTDDAESFKTLNKFVCDEIEKLLGADVFNASNEPKKIGFV